MSRIGLSGYYGMSNYGDDLFLMAAFLGARKYWSQHEPRLLCEPVPGLDARYSFFPLIPRGALASCGIKGKLSRVTNLMWSAITLDKFVFAGGSLFSAASSGAQDTLIRLKRRRRDYFSAIGVSIGPFTDSATEKAVIEKLRRFEYISVRDASSYDKLMSHDLDLKIVKASDLVGVLPSLVSCTPVSKRFDHATIDDDSETLKIGFSPCYLADSDARARYYCDQFVSYVSRLSRERRLNVEVICLNQHPVVGDVHLCNYVVGNLVSKGVDCSLRLYQEEGVLGTWQRISELDAYYSVRLHGAITAYLSAVPFFLFEYHEKCTQFLDFIGKPDHQRVLRNEAVDTDLSPVFMNVLMSPHQSALSVAEYVSLSEKNFTCATFI